VILSDQQLVVCRRPPGRHSLLASCEKFLDLQLKNSESEMPKIIFHCELAILVVISRSIWRISFILKFLENETLLKFSRNAYKCYFGSYLKHIFGESLELTTSRFHVLVKFSNWWPFLTWNLPRPRLDSSHKMIWLTMRRFLIGNSINRVIGWGYEGRVHCVDVYEISLWNSNFVLQITFIEIHKKSYIRFFFFLPISVFKS